MQGLALLSDGMRLQYIGERRHGWREVVSLVGAVAGFVQIFTTASKIMKRGR
jgi:hypothetical protein